MLGVVILINFILGLSSTGIDNWAHLGIHAYILWLLIKLFLSMI